MSSSSSSEAAAAGAAASAPVIRESPSIAQFVSEIGQEQASFRSRVYARFSDYQKRAAKSLGSSPFNGFEPYPKENWRHAEYIGYYMANKLVLLYNLNETKYRAIADAYKSCGEAQHVELQKVTSYQEIDDWMQRNILDPLSPVLGQPKTDQSLASQRAASLAQDNFDIPDLSTLSKRELAFISPTPLASERDAINLRYQHRTAAGGALGAAASAAAAAGALGAAASAPVIRESPSIAQFESEIGREQSVLRILTYVQFVNGQKKAAESLGHSPFNGFEPYPGVYLRHAEYICDYMANKLVLLYNLDNTKYRAIADAYKSCGEAQHVELQKVTSYQEIDDWMQRNILDPLSPVLGQPKTDQGLARQKAALLTQNRFDIPDLSKLSEGVLVSPTPLASERDAINLRYQHRTAAGGALGAAASAAAAAGALGAAAAAAEPSSLLSADNPDAYRPAEGTASDRSASELSRTIGKTRRSPSEAAAAALAAAGASPAAQVQPTTWGQWLSGHARSAVSHLTGGGKGRGK